MKSYDIFLEQSRAFNIFNDGAKRSFDIKFEDKFVAGDFLLYNIKPCRYRTLASMSGGTLSAYGKMILEELRYIETE